MKNLLLFFLLLFPLVSLGQSTFVKTIDGMHFGGNTRVIQTNDQGIAVFSLDSLKLYKFNSCGNPEWAKQYNIPIGFYVGDIIKTQSGGFALLNRIPLGTTYSFSVTVLDATGAVTWSKAYEDPAFTLYPYTLVQTANGDFMITANANHNGSNQHNNLISRLDANGNLLWTRFYNFGPIWGGGIATSDNHFVARFGNTVFKSDAAGNILWANSVFGTSNHFAPIEVSDGYIFTGSKNGSGPIAFYKINNQGNLVWGGRKVIDFAGIPPLLYKKSNGNFTGIFNRWANNNNLASVIEFDKELNVVKQSALNFDQNLASFTGRHVGFSDENATIFTGLANLNLSGPKLFVAKTDADLQTGCDTTIAINIVSEPVTQTPVISSNVAHTFQVATKTVPVKTIPATATTHCSNFIPVKLNIRTDTLLCANTPLALRDRSGTALDSYLWSTGETTATIAVTKPGKYWLRATYNCGTQTASDTVTVTSFIFPQPALTPDTTACFKEPVQLNAELPGATYRWQDGSTNAVYQATKPGKYDVEITYQTCTKKFSVRIGDYEKLLMPNVFTPNNDNRNDTFAPMEMCGIASGTMKIFNRWGLLIYETSEIGKGWNGRINGQKSADGVYYHLLEYTNFRDEQKMKKGWLELVGN